MNNHRNTVGVVMSKVLELWLFLELIVSLTFFFPCCREFMANTYEQKAFGKLSYIRKNTCCCYWEDSRSVKRPRWPSLHGWVDSLPTQTSRSSPITPRALQDFALQSECPSQFQGKLGAAGLWTDTTVQFNIYFSSCLVESRTSHAPILFNLYIFGSH